jgi:hypothetical protein
VTRFVGLLVAALAAFSVSTLVAQSSADRFIPVTQKDLNDPDPADWLMLGGNMGHWNYSRLDQINRSAQCFCPTTLRKRSLDRSIQFKLRPDQCPRTRR